MNNSMNSYWKRMPTRRAILFTSGDLGEWMDLCF